MIHNVISKQVFVLLVTLENISMEKNVLIVQKELILLQLENQVAQNVQLELIHHQKDQLHVQIVQLENIIQILVQLLLLLVKFVQLELIHYLVLQVAQNVQKIRIIQIQDQIHLLPV